MDRIKWLREQLARAREVEADYLLAMSRWPDMWTATGQRMLDSVRDNRMYFEHELKEALCLRLRN